MGGNVPAGRRRRRRRQVEGANDEGLAVSVRGAGTKQSWSARAGRTDVVLSTLGLNAPADHVAGDLVATVPPARRSPPSTPFCGASVNGCRSIRACPKRATIGGIIATNDSGPRRHRFGTPRDLIIGIEIALADGRIARAGGRVVKNVAGYDLSRLVCGSFGSLAVVTSATFKLAPLPPASPDAGRLATGRPECRGARCGVAGSTLTPSAVELQSPPHRLLVRFETSRARPSGRLPLRPACARRTVRRTEVLTGQAEATPGGPTSGGWRAMPARWSNGDAANGRGRNAVRVETLTAEHGIGTRQPGGPPSACLVRFGGDPGSQARSSANCAARRRPGAAAPCCWRAARPQSAAWRVGPNGDAVPIMRAVKARFDPRGT